MVTPIWNLDNSMLMDIGYRKTSSVTHLSKQKSIELLPLNASQKFASGHCNSRIECCYQTAIHPTILSAKEYII